VSKAWKKANKKRVAEKSAKRYKKNQERLKEYSKTYYYNNIEKVRQYYKDNREKIIERVKQYQKENPEVKRRANRKYKKAHPEIRNKQLKRYKKRYPEKAKAHKQKRRARKAGAEGSFSGWELNELFAWQEGRCHYCGEYLYSKWEEGRAPYDIEHKIPLSRGGTNYIDNIALACADCNSSKGPLTEEEFKNGTTKDTVPLNSGMNNK
jgi:CRISPR/Cas system Type II protein with McrA/HNH and RuvC-like nuclease domain